MFDITMCWGGMGMGLYSNLSVYYVIFNFDEH